MLRVLHGELDVALAGGDELRARIARGLGAPLAHRLGQPLEADRRHLRQQRGHVGEMMRRRGMRYAGAAGAAAQREAVHALLRQLRLGGLEQRGPEVAVVIASAARRARRLRRRGVAHLAIHDVIHRLVIPAMYAADLDNVQIAMI